MEDPIALKRRMASIIIKFLERVKVRNQIADLLQSEQQNQCSINEYNLMGVPIMNLDSEYIYWRSGYAYDIRELYHVLRAGYHVAKCPYTNLPFTRYQKYYIVRRFYRIQADPEFEPLIMDHVSYYDYEQCKERINQLMDPYNRFDISIIDDQHLFNLLTELIKYDVKDSLKSSTYLAQAHYHYINRNMQKFRMCSYLFLLHMIVGYEIADRSTICLRIKARLEYINYMYPIEDPLTIPRITVADILGLGPPPSRRRSRSPDHDEGPDRQRRRTQSPSSTTSTTSPW